MLQLTTSLEKYSKKVDVNFSDFPFAIREIWNAWNDDVTSKTMKNLEFAKSVNADLAKNYEEINEFEATMENYKEHESHRKLIVKCLESPNH